jgi:hypothetical protein
MKSLQSKYDILSATHIQDDTTHYIHQRPTWKYINAVYFLVS